MAESRSTAVNRTTQKVKELGGDAAELMQYIQQQADKERTENKIQERKNWINTGMKDAGEKGKAGYDQLDEQTKEITARWANGEKTTQQERLQAKAAMQAAAEKAGAGDWNDVYSYAAYLNNPDEVQLGTGVLSSVAGVGESLAGGVMSAADTALQAANRAATGSDVPINTYSPWQELARKSEATTEQVSENIQTKVDGTADKEGLTWGKAAAFSYQTFMSGVNSAAVGLMPGGAALLGVGAGASAAREALDEGATNGQALTYGILSGWFEGLFEEYSIGNLKKYFGTRFVKGPKDFLKNLGKTTFVNASEEFATQVADDIAEYFALGDLSQLQQVYDNALQAGANENEAALEAAKWFAKDTLLAGLGGALMGLGFGVAGGSINMNSQALADYAETRTEIKQRETAGEITKEQANKEIQAAQKQAGFDEQTAKAVEAQLKVQEDFDQLQKMALGEDEKPMPGDEDAPPAEAEQNMFVDPVAAMAAQNAQQENYRQEEKPLPGDELAPEEQEQDRMYLDPVAAMAEQNEVNVERILNSTDELTDYQAAQLLENKEELAAATGVKAEAIQDIEDVKAIVENTRSINETNNRYAQEADAEAARQTPLSDEVKGKIEKIGNNLGVNIEYGDLADGLDGKYDPKTKTITLSRNITSGKAAMYVMLHELTHSAENSKTYEKMVKYLITSKTFNNWLEEEMGFNGENPLQEFKEFIRDRYSEDGSEPLTDDEQMQEVVAFFMQSEKVDQKFFDELAGENRNLLQRMWDWAKAAIKSIGDGGESIELKRIERMMRKALDETQRENRKKDEIEKYSLSNRMANSLKAVVKENSSEASRAAEIKKMRMTADFIDTSRIENAIEKVVKEYTNIKRNTKEFAKKVAENLGVYGSYSIPGLKFAVSVTPATINESYNKDAVARGQENELFKAIANLNLIMKNAMPIEAHTDRYSGTNDAEQNLKLMHMVFSGYIDENGAFVPVLLGVKEYKNKAIKPLLYIITTGKKIEAGVNIDSSDREKSHQMLPTLPASGVMLSELVKEVNTKDGAILEYFPDELLTKEQILSKRWAQRMNQLKVEFSRHNVYDSNRQRGTIRKVERESYNAISDELGEEAAYKWLNKIISKDSMDTLEWSNGTPNMYTNALDHIDFGRVNEIKEEKAEKIIKEKLPVQEKFSKKLQLPVERTRNLIALHNLTEENLRYSLEHGGFPAPSIAIVKAMDGHSMYGPISMVFGTDTIDPKKNKKNKIFGADAYTPTRSNVTTARELNQKKFNEFENHLRNISKKLPTELAGNISVFIHSIPYGYDGATKETIEELTRGDIRDQNIGMAAAFLVDNGIDPDIRYKEAKDAGYFKENLPIYEEFLKEYGKDAENDIRYELPIKFIEKYGSSKAIELANRFGYKTDLKLQSVRAARMVAEVRNWIKNKKHFIDGEAEYDALETEWAIDEQIDEHGGPEAVNEWLRSIMNGMIGEEGVRNNKDSVTQSGRRRSYKELYEPATIENILKAMFADKKSRGVNAYYNNAQGMQALTAEEYSNIDKVREDQERLTDLDETKYKEMNQEVEDSIRNALNDIGEYLKNTYGASDLDVRRINDIAVEETAGPKATAAKIQNAYKKQGYNVPDEICDKILNAYKMAGALPTKYFEAKPERAVGFDEVEAVLMPDTVDVKLKQSMLDLGVEVITYNGTDEDRAEKLNSLDRLKFSKDIGKAVAERKKQQENIVAQQQYDIQKKIEKERRETKDRVKKTLPEQLQEVREKLSRSEERVKEYVKKNRILKQQIDVLGKEFELTFGHKITLKTAGTIADDIIKETDATMSRSEISRRITDIFQEVSESEKPNFERVMTKTVNLMKEVLEGSRTVENSLREDEREANEFYDRTNRIAVTDEEWRDIVAEHGKPGPGNRLTYTDSKGRSTSVILAHSQNGRGVYDLYAGELIKDDSPYQRYISGTAYNSGDAFNAILDARAMVNAHEEHNQYVENDAVNDEAAKLAQTVFNQYLGAPAYINAQSQQQAINSLRQAWRSLAEEADRQTKRAERAEKRTEQLKDTHTKQGLRKQISQKTSWFVQVATHPTAAKHVPIKLKGICADIAELMTIVESSRQSRDPEARTKVAERMNSLLDKIHEVQQESGRTGDDLLGDDWYQSRVYDRVQELKKMLTETTATGETFAATGEMNQTELRALNDILGLIRHNIEFGNRLIADEKNRAIHEVAAACTAEIRQSNGTKGLSRKTSEYLFEVFTPKTYFNMMSGWKQGSQMSSMFEMLNAGQRKMQRIQMEAAAIFAELTDVHKGQNKQLLREFTGEHAKLIDVGLKDENGNTVKITPAMLCSLWMHLQNAQNRSHMEYSGLTLPDMELYLKGKTKEAWAASVRCTVPLLDIKANVGKAMIENKYCQKWCVKARVFFDGYSKNILNETSLQLMGIEKAIVKNYFPIRSDKNFTERRFDEVVRNGSIEGNGSLKERSARATSPMLLEDITQVINSQTEFISRYGGMAIPLRNMSKIWSVNSAGYADSMHNAMAHRYGDQAVEYLNLLMGDLNGSTKRDNTPISKMLRTIRGNYAQSVLTMNPVSAISQISLPSAGSVLGAKATFKAFKDLANVTLPGGRSRKLDEINREMQMHGTATGWIRKKGSTGELYDLINNPNWFTKFATSGDILGRTVPSVGMVGSKLTTWIARMDENTIASIWQASKYAAEEKGLKQGEEKYWDTVRDLFDRAVEETQPNYQTMQMVQAARSTNELKRTFTMFKSPFMSTANSWYDALGFWQANRKSSSEVVRRMADKRLRMAAGAMLGQAALAAVMRVAAQGLVYHKWDDDRDETGEVTVMNTMLNILNKMLSNIVSQAVPILGGDIYELVSAPVTKTRYYGDSLQDNSFEVINKIMTDLNNIEAEVLDEETNIEKIKKYTASGLTDLSMALGVPVSAGKNWVKAVMAYADDLNQGLTMGSYSTTKNNAAAGIDKAITGKRNYDLAHAQSIVDRYMESSTAADPAKALKTALKDQYRTEYAEADEETRRKMKAVLTGVTADGEQLLTDNEVERFEYEAAIKAAGVSLSGKKEDRLNALRAAGYTDAEAIYEQYLKN